MRFKKPSEMDDNELIKELMKLVPEYKWELISEVRDRFGRYREEGYTAAMAEAYGDEQ